MKKKNATAIERISFRQIAGPFPNPVKNGQAIGLDTAYAPEKECPVDINARYRGKGGCEVRWREIWPQSNGFYELGFAVPAPQAVAYVLCYLFAQKPGRVELRFASYHGLKVFLNGKAVGLIPPGNYDVLVSPRVFRVMVRAGRNELLVKCEHGAGNWGFFFGATMARPTLSEYFRREAAERARRCSLPPPPPRFHTWQQRVRRELIQLMAFPKKRVRSILKETEQIDCGGYIKHRLYLRTEKHWELPLLLLVPKSARPDHSAKALLCLHGHGHGKADTTQDFDFPAMGQLARDIEYDYGRLYAEAGYVVMSLDSRAFGELGDMACPAAYAAANAIGRPLVGMRVWDAMRALDVLLARPEVDPRRVGCTGMSWGGTHTAYLMMVETRLKAALVAGYFSDFADILYRTPVCPCQYLPGVADRFDFPELLFGLAAPRPLYIQNGMLDELYTLARVRAAFRRGKQIYKQLGVPDRAVLQVHEKGHLYRFSAARAWFEKVL